MVFRGEGDCDVSEMGKGVNCIVIYSNYTFCDDHFVVIQRPKLLRCTTVTNIMLYTNFTSIKK